MKLTWILMGALSLISAAYADDSSTAKVQFADCTENARKIGEAIAASAPNGKVDSVETSAQDLDPNRPSRSYYVTVSYPIPQEDDYDVRLQHTSVYRISYEDGKWSGEAAAKTFQEGCYMIGITEIHSRL